MSYVLAVVPNMLSDGTGMPIAGIFVATAVASGIASILMGLISNYPIGIAPGMGLTSLFTYTICISMHTSWETALATVFLAGIIFLIITVSDLRTRILNSMAPSLRVAIMVGIGFFIAFVGLQGSGIIVPSASTLVQLGDLTSPTVLLAIVGIFITLRLYTKNVQAAVFIGISITVIIGLILGFLGFSGMPILTMESTNLGFSTFGAFTRGFEGLFNNILDFIVVLFSLVMVSFFDTTGTLIPLATKMGLENEDGTIERIDKAFLVDATSVIIGSICGVSTMTAFLESSTGIDLGGRTGLTAIFIGIFFFLSITLAPIILGLITSSVTASALVVMGVIMMMEIRNVDMSYMPTAATTFVTIIMMTLTYSITIGTAFGFITYFLTSLSAGDREYINLTMSVLVVIFAIYLIFCV